MLGLIIAAVAGILIGLCIGAYILMRVGTSLLDAFWKGWN